MAEKAAGERRGGPTTAMLKAVNRAEEGLFRTKPANADDFQWIANRLARAIENGWAAEATAPLVMAARSS